jgi:Glycosyltransferase family 87
MQHLLYKKIRIGSKYECSLSYIIWFLLAIIAVSLEMSRGITSIDNYLIYKGVYDHVVQQKYLFSFYPLEYVSFNNYGPAFSLIIAPFAVLPVYVGCFLWAIANAGCLFYAIKLLPINENQKTLIYWISCIEMMTSIHNVQFNAMFTSFVIFSFVFTLRGKDWLATLFIALGILTKLYGVGALAFFFFSKNKKQFIGTFIMWMAIIIVLPMIYSSYEYIIQCYKDWYFQIIRRNDQNINNSRNAGLQDISVPGMIRRIFNYYGSIDFKIIALAGVAFIVPLFKKNIISNIKFQLQYLALVLISVVIYSSAAESPTFVIAVCGTAIWFVLQQTPITMKVKIMLVLLFMLTILSPTDLVPKFIRDHFILAYSLKALPCFMIWCWLIVDVWKWNNKTILDIS